jgi:hypothetical protein
MDCLVVLILATIPFYALSPWRGNGFRCDDYGMGIDPIKKVSQTVKMLDN